MDRTTTGSGGRISGSGGRAEANRWLEIAGKLLQARDLVGSKRFAERAMDVDPLLDGADEIVAVADVLLASQRRINNHHDWYTILQVDTNSSAGSDHLSIRLAYRRLALLLRPDSNRNSGSDLAFKLVSDAWAVLSDPTKKRLYDDEIKIASSHSKSNGPEKPSPPPPPATFWTMCSGCFRIFEYEKMYENRNLRCQYCQRPFQATELPTSPPIVPGADMYYCSWGMFPLGFPGSPVFTGVTIPDCVLRVANFPNCPPQPEGPQREGRANVTVDGNANSQSPAKYGSGRKTPENVNVAEVNRRVTRSSTTPSKSPVTRPKKVLAKKPRKQPRRAAKGSAGGNANEDVGCSANAGDAGVGFDMNNFSIDLDTTAEVLGNLANLPFLKDDEVAIIQ